MPTPPSDGSRRSERIRFVGRLVLLVVIFASVYWLGDRLELRVNEMLASLKERNPQILLAALALYVLFLAIPFVPGVELGIIVMLVGGVEGVALVYSATLMSLSLSYGLGRMVPVSILGGLFGWLGFRRAETLVYEMDEMSAHQRMLYLTRRIPGRWLPFFLRHRYLAVAVALNTPGNVLIGGGGGIGMVAGISGLFPFGHYLVLIAVAVSPVPLMLIGKAGLA